MTEEELDRRLKAIIVRHAGIAADAARIETETALVDDLRMDSMQIVHLFADLEDEFRIRIRVQDIDTPILHAYGHMRAYIGRLIEGRAADGAGMAAG